MNAGNGSSISFQSTQGFDHALVPPGPPVRGSPFARPACQRKTFHALLAAIRAWQTEQMGHPNKSAILVHNERTGGNSLHEAVGSLYGSKSILINSPIDLNIQKKTIVEALFEAPHYVAGHVTLPEFQNALKGIERKDIVFFTCIRDPIERIVSLYNFNLRVPAALGSVYKETAGKGFSYFYFYMVANYPSMVVNSQCRYLSGAGFVEARIALENTFDAVADLSRIDDLLSHVVKLTGGKTTSTAPRLNSNAESASNSEVVRRLVGPALRRKMESDNTEDLVLRECLLNDYDGFFRSNHVPDEVTVEEGEPCAQS
ncbi:sulfotransferase family 2 domain-containing protein [Methylorubrum extorquens]|uniref:sulfotransferase family 2 domain-containing protein n=1 Tax=Methylorubrum extorquens TaxID=408 RepID=UPI0018C87FC7|nr:sulfotransferase family 2 domain-containing protein [Methylorubrum extorquens]